MLNEMLNGNPSNYVKEGIMYVIQHIAEIVMGDDHLMRGMEDLLQRDIFPELTSQDRLLSYRAFSIYSTYDISDFSDDHLYEVGKLAMDAMRSDDLPIRVIAGIALDNFINCKATGNLYKDNLCDILKDLLEIMEIYFTSELVDTLKNLVHEFYEDITPFAVNLCKKLSENYIEIMGEFDPDSNDADSRQL